MLLGQYEGKVSGKSRVTIPSKFRDSVKNKIIITKGYENSLIIVTTEGWKALLEGTEGQPFTNQSTRETQRFLLGGASDCELDDKGRFIIPAYLQDYAGIKDEVIFLGIDRYIELWDKTKWEVYTKYLEKNITTIGERLKKKEQENG